MEQVPGLLSSNGGEDFREALLTLLDLGATDIGWRVLDAQWFGVPQRRRRMFIVCDFGGERAGEILALAEGLRGDSAPSREKRQELAANPSSGVNSGCWWNGDNVAPTLHGSLHNQNLRPSALSAPNTIGAVVTFAPPAAYVAEVAKSLTASNQRLDPAVETFVVCTTGEKTHALTSEGSDVSEDGTGRGTPVVAYGLDAEMNGTRELLNGMKAQGTGSIQCGAVAEPIGFPSRGINDIGECGLPMSRGSNPPAVAFTASSQANSYAWESPVYPTLNAQVPNDTSNIQYGVRQGWRVRRLTPRECERLMGWPDDHTRWGRKVDGKVYEQADGPRYKQCGNEVVANVSEWLARNLMSFEMKVAA